MSENKLSVCLQKEKRVNSRYFVFETISLWSPDWSQTQFSYFSLLNAGLPSVYHQLWLLKPSGRSEHLEEVEYTSFTEGCRASMSCVKLQSQQSDWSAVTFNSANREGECLSPFTGSSTSLNRTLITGQQRTWPLQWFLSFIKWHSQVINNLPLPWAEDAKLRTSAEREDDHNTTVRINTKWVYFQSSHWLRKSQWRSGEDWSDGSVFARWGVRAVVPI